MARNTPHELNNRAWLSIYESEINNRYHKFLKDNKLENTFASAETFVVKHLSINDLESIKVGNNLYEKGKLMKKISGCDYPHHYH